MYVHEHKSLYSNHNAVFVSPSISRKQFVFRNREQRKQANFVRVICHFFLKTDRKDEVTYE